MTSPLAEVETMPYPRAGEAKEKFEHAEDKIEDVIGAAKDRVSHGKD